MKPRSKSELEKELREVEEQSRELWYHVQHANAWVELGSPVEALNELNKIPGVRAQRDTPRGLRKVCAVCRDLWRTLRKRRR
jgi:hypothetical protein